MAGKVEDIEKLFDLQEVDNMLENGAQAFNESPIAKDIAVLRVKKKKLKEKRDQVDRVFVKARQEIEVVSTKDSQLAAAQDKEQEEIENTQGDYRKVEAHTHKLNELTNQRKQVDKRLEELEANFNKIKELKAKIDKNIEALSLKEDALSQDLERTNVQLKLDMDAATKKKEQLEKEISADALAVYKKARGMVGQSVIAKLEDDSCTVCRSKVSQANLSKLQKDAPISVCPNCLRLIVIQ